MGPMKLMVIPPLSAIWVPLMTSMMPLAMSASTLSWHLLPILSLSTCHQRSFKPHTI